MAGTRPQPAATPCVSKSCSFSCHVCRREEGEKVTSLPHCSIGTGSLFFFLIDRGGCLFPSLHAFLMTCSSTGHTLAYHAACQNACLQERRDRLGDAFYRAVQVRERERRRETSLLFSFPGS